MSKKVCAFCELYKPRADFNGHEWVKISRRKCDECKRKSGSLPCKDALSRPSRMCAPSCRAVLLVLTCMYCTCRRLSLRMCVP